MLTELVIEGTQPFLRIFFDGHRRILRWRAGWRTVFALSCGAMCPSLHSCWHIVQTQQNESEPRSCFTSAARVQTPGAPHFGQGVRIWAITSYVRRFHQSKASY
jgi:hypothetical protein